ncbi:MAG: hypothetical protein EAX96_00800 [Candidatus Lokiarchaeota archaeon]|nr:hypothetical protein [Candidatus Lokiarchaeota archaeon]
MIEPAPIKRKKTKTEKLAYGITIATITPFQILLIIWFSYSICHSPQLIALGNQGYPHIYIYQIIIDTISIFFISIFPLLPVFILNKKGKIKSYTTQREDRFVLLGLSSIGWFIVILVYIILDQILLVNMRNFIIFGTAYFIIALINIVITSGLKFKTSLHMSGATSSITMLYISYAYFGGVPEYQLLALLFLFLPPIAWAKWKMQKSFQRGHTIPQLISGFLIGFIVVYLTIITYRFLGFPIAWF